MYKTMCKIN